MKTFKIISAFAIVMAITSVAVAQDKIETFKVSGNCGMCKSKIEKAAKEAGAKTASWDADKKELTVSYKSSTTNTAKIQKKIADVGYDNAGFKATLETYKKLHGCCQYEREDGTAAETKASCCKEGEKCTHNHTDGHQAKADCCKDGKCTKEGHNGKDCCKKDGDMSCCKDGKCTKPGHDGKDCCKKEEHKH